MIYLQNQRILVTREESDAARFASEIVKYGGHPITMPLIQIHCLASEDQKQSLVTDIDYDWIFFTSKNGVNCFFERLENERLLQKRAVKIAAVGSKTADALIALGYHVDFIPSQYNAEVMAAEFITKYPDTGRALFVRGVLASNILIDAFTKVKRQFDCYEVYDTKVNTTIKKELNNMLDNQKVDVLTFMSPSTIHAFVKLVDKPEMFFATPTVCIGTTTERQAREVGFTETIVPEVFTTNGMVFALSHYLKERSNK